MSNGTTKSQSIATATNTGKGGVMDRTDCPAPRHGTYGAYQVGCRCDDTKEIGRVRGKRYRQGRHAPSFAPVLGSQRRLQALMALGYSLVRLGLAMGIAPQHLRVLLNAHRPRVTLQTAAKVAAVYDNLCMTVPEKEYNNNSVGLTRALAARRGYAPPLAWDDIDNPSEQPQQLVEDPVRVHRNDFTVDPVKVARCTQGLLTFGALTTGEKREVLMALTTRGFTPTAIALRVSASSAVIAERLAELKDAA